MVLDQQPDTIDHLQEDITTEDILDDVLGGGDFIDDLDGLKGIVSASLGRLGFKFSFVIVLLFNFVYTVHNAFAQNTKTEISVISFNNCSCDSRDRLFYSAITYGFIGLWIVFLFICALHSIYKFIHKLCCTNDITDSNHEVSTQRGVSTRKDLIPEKHYWFLKREIFKLTAMILYLNKQSLHSKEISSIDEITSAVNYLLAHMKHKFLKVTDPPMNFATDNVCKISKYVLVISQFLLRLPIVPLLLLQWLDEYSWNCVIGSVKNYCKDMVVGYIFDQSMVISCLYICVLLAIIIAISMQYMPVNKLTPSRKSVSSQSNNGPDSQSKCFSRSKWCLLFKAIIQVNHTLFLTNVGFVMIIALIYTSILSQFTYVAITEAERDVNIDKTFNFGEKWLNRSISGGVSNFVLWKCVEKSSSPYLQAIFATLLLVLIATLLFYAAMALMMAFVNYQRVKKLIYHYYGDKMCSNSKQLKCSIADDKQLECSITDDSKSIITIVMILHQLFQLRYLEIPKVEIKRILYHYWKDAYANIRSRSLCRWYSVLFLIPAIELILILLLILLVLTSYNVHPIGCFFTDVHYDESTNRVRCTGVNARSTYLPTSCSGNKHCCLLYVNSCQIFTHLSYFGFGSRFASIMFLPV